MKIICLGDSNTYGYDPRDYFGGRYPMAWPDIMRMETGWDIVNLGENGREIPHTGAWICAIDQQIESLFPAELLIILLGSNDLMNIRQVTVKDIASRMTMFISHIRKAFPELNILLLSPMQITMLAGEVRDVSGNLATAYKKIAEEFHIRFADTNEWKPAISFDGIHLTEEGHRTLAEKLIRILS